MTWTCQRHFTGVPCKHVNSNRKRLCGLCGKPRPKRKAPAHRSALALTYEEFEAINGGPACGICGAVRQPGQRRLHRDHDHRVPYAARGLLCFRCNTALRPYMTLEWLRRAIAYLERTALPEEL